MTTDIHPRWTDPLFWQDVARQVERELATAAKAAEKRNARKSDQS